MIRNDIYKGLDAMKLLCAFLVVYIHTYNGDWGIVGSWFKSVITSAAVPFFFIVSGFFYIKGLMRNKFHKDYFLKYFRRLLLFYIVWTIISIPVSWLCTVRGHPDYTLSLKVVFLFRMFFFSGSCGYYWYVISLIYCCPVLYFFISKGWNKYLYILAVLMFGIGIWYNSSSYDNNMMFQFIHVVFGSERNFINQGLFYMSLGCFFANHELKMNYKSASVIFLLAIVILLRTLEVVFMPISVLQALVAVLLFILALNIRVGFSVEMSFYIRKWSTALYMIHCPFILLFDFYLSKGTIVDYVSAVCLSTLLYVFIINTLPLRWQHALLG